MGSARQRQDSDYNGRDAELIHLFPRVPVQVGCTSIDKTTCYRPGRRLCDQWHKKAVSRPGDPHTRFRYFCSPQHTDSAFYPIISQMERAAGLAHDDTLQARLDKLDALLAQTSTSKQDAALFANLLSPPNDGRYPAIELLPQQRRQRTLEAL